MNSIHRGLEEGRGGTRSWELVQHPIPKFIVQNKGRLLVATCYPISHQTGLQVHRNHRVVLRRRRCLGTLVARHGRGLKGRRLRKRSGCIRGGRAGLSREEMLLLRSGVG